MAGKLLLKVFDSLCAIIRGFNSSEAEPFEQISEDRPNITIVLHQEDRKSLEIVDSQIFLPPTPCTDTIDEAC